MGVFADCGPLPVFVSNHVGILSFLVGLRIDPRSLYLPKLNGIRMLRRRNTPTIQIK